MTTKESKAIDALLVQAILARTKGVSADDILGAFAFDISLLRAGKETHCTADLIWKTSQEIGTKDSTTRGRLVAADMKHRLPRTINGGCICGTVLRRIIIIIVLMMTCLQKNWSIKMTTKESTQLDICLALLSMASAKGADATDMLNAFAFDMNLIRKGENPTETQKLIEW